MTVSDGGSPAGHDLHGLQTARWSLVLGLVTVASIIGLSAGAFGAPGSVLLVLVAVAAVSGLGSMVLGVASLLPRKNLSDRARRQAFAGAALGSLILVGIGLVAASALSLSTQNHGVETQFAAQAQQALRAEQRCVSAAQSSGASAQSAFEQCLGSPQCPSSTPTTSGPVSGAIFCTTTSFSRSFSTNTPWPSILALLVWAGLVFVARWLVFGSRDPPRLAGTGS